MVLSEDQTMAAGRILVHGFLLTCYLLMFISEPQLYFILTGKKPSKSMIYESFNLLLDDMDRDTIIKAIRLTLLK